MKQFVFILCLSLLISCSDNAKEKQNEAAYDLSNVPDFEFKMVGEDQEDNTKLVSKIEIIRKGQNAVVQVLEGFKAEVAKNEAVTFEDLNFDNLKDLRLMQFLPTDESIAYFYWIYDSEKERFIRNEELEKQVFSPSIDKENQWLVSQWRKNDGTFGSDAFRFTSAFDCKLVQSEKNIPYQDSMYKQVITLYENGDMKSTKENIYKPELRIPLPY